MSVAEPIPLPTSTASSSFFGYFKSKYVVRMWVALCHAWQIVGIASRSLAYQEVKCVFATVSQAGWAIQGVLAMTTS